MENKKIRVLIVDDSAIVRESLGRIVAEDPLLEVSNMAADPFEAVKMIAEELPDVITLDLEMPRMDGLTFLQRIMQQHPIPVVVISSLAGQDSDIGDKALRMGAVEVITKPRMGSSFDRLEYQIRICDAIRAAALSRIARKIGRIERIKQILKPKTATPVLKIGNAEKIVLIGASTGGTELIAKILKGLEPGFPPLLIVQHMPGEFTKSFAKRLNDENSFLVKEAEHGEQAVPGQVYIANGYKHLLLQKRDGHFYCELQEGELVNRHRPSIDVLFKSAAKVAGKNAMGILLTGMGNDGAKGLLELRQTGANCIAQDEKSSVVFGMPKEAINLNAANLVGNPDDIIRWINTIA